MSHTLKKMEYITPREIHKLGIRHIPEDRQKSGVIANFTVSENKILNDYYQKPFSSNYIMSWGDVERVSETVVKTLTLELLQLQHLLKIFPGAINKSL